MVQNYEDIIKTASLTNNSNELDETYIITKEKVTNNNKEIEQLYLKIKNPSLFYTNKFLLTPDIIAKTKYKEVVYKYFANEYLSLEDSLKIEGKIDLSEDHIKLLIAVGLGNIARLKEYSKSSIMIILGGHYGESKIILFQAISKYLSNNTGNEDVKKENEELKKQIENLNNNIVELKSQYDTLKKEFEEYKNKHPEN